MSPEALLLLADFLGLLIALGFLAVTVLPGVIGRSLNGVIDRPSGPPSDAAQALHGTLDVVDLHADTLLWRRDLLARGRWGHVDVPRLVEGRVRVQGFTAVTKAPRGMNIESNRGDSDMIALLALLQGWPPRTWWSPMERALHQARRLRAAAARSGGTLTVLHTRADLEAHMARRAAGEPVVAGLLGMEGAHALEGDLANLERAFAAGFRLVGLTHFFDNQVGGSAHGVAKGGLTDLGRRVVARMEELGMLVDLAHASDALIDDVLSVATRPVVVSHTGVRGTCDNRRNLDDARLRAVADAGGVVGIGLWKTAICGARAEDWARSVRHALDVAGPDHVALGSDWDGAVGTIVDAAGTVRLTEALLGTGLSKADIRRVMGDNAVRLLRATLPETEAAAGA